MKKSQRVYLAGPMRGYRYFNFPNFDFYALKWRRAGYKVVNPAELDRVQAHVHEYTKKYPKGFLRDAMKRDLTSICDCDIIALLKGWERSAGVKVELELAKLLGLKIFCARTMKRITVR